VSQIDRYVFHRQMRGEVINFSIRPMMAVLRHVSGRPERVSTGTRGAALCDLQSERWTLLPSSLIQ
jgi:hypothetical protein